MSFMGGYKSEKQQQQTNQQTDPWAPAVPMLNDLLSKAQSNATAHNVGVTTNAQGQALNQLAANAKQGDPNAGAIRDVSTGLLHAPDHSGMVTAGYDDLQRRLAPTADGTNQNLDQDKYLQPLLQQLGDNAAKRTNAMFAGAGRDLSPDNVTATSRGVTQAMAPILFEQFNHQQGRTDAAARDLFGASTNTATTTAGLDQGRAQLQKLGIDIGDKALEARDYAPQHTLAVENLRKQLPLDELGYLQSILQPIAGLGSTMSGKSTKNTSGFNLSGGFSIPKPA